MWRKVKGLKRKKIYLEVENLWLNKGEVWMDRAENSINSIVAMMQCDIFTTSHVKSKSRGFRNLAEILS